MAIAKADQPQEVEGDAGEQREGRHQLERVIDVAECLLQAEGEEDDPGDHREVQVRVGVSREFVALRGPRERGRAAGPETSATTSK